MTRHVADKPGDADDGQRLSRFAAIEKDSAGARHQTLTLQRRQREARDDGRRAAEFLRIERGRTA